MLKYLEVDSTHRNRKEFPNPAQFNLLSNQKASTNAITAVDPVCLSNPIITYTTVNIDNNLISNSIPDAKSNSTTDAVFWFKKNVRPHNPRHPSRISNYYRGCEILLRIAGVDVGRIVVNSWDYLSTRDLGDGNPLDLFRVSYSPPIDSLQFPLIDYVKLSAPTQLGIGLAFIPLGSLTSQAYKDWFLWNEVKKAGRKIIAYDGANAIASVDSNTFIDPWSDNFNIGLRKELPLVCCRQILVGSTPRVIKTNIRSTESGIYIGDFLRISDRRVWEDNDIDIQNETRQIIDYNKDGTITIDSPFSVLPLPGTDMEILQFSYDNYEPFVYTGTNIQTEACYEVQLIHLILPNLGVEGGGVIQSYPYFYVEFQNYSTTGGGTWNVMYSNNSVSSNKLFRVPVTDISSPSLNSFVTLDKCYMSQIMKLKPDSSFKFGVYLPDGTPFQTIISDTVSPSAPNPNVQISALFSLRKH